MENKAKATQYSVQKIMTIAILTSIGILIPIIMPFKIIIGPFSWTLGSHLAIAMAMFISPGAAAFVALGSSLGFFFAGFPFPIVLRAVSHVLFAIVGAYILNNNAAILNSWKTRTSFSFLINLLHGLGEMTVIFLLTLAGINTLDGNFITSLVVLFGVSPLLHGMMDFELGYRFTQLLQTRIPLTFPNFSSKENTN